MSRRSWMVLTAAVLLAALPAAAEDWNKKFGVTGKPEVRVETNDAHVRVNSWDHAEVDAHVTTEGWRIAEGSAALSTGDEVRVSARQDGNHIEIEIRIPQRHWHVGIDRRSVHIELMVPRVSNLAVHTQDGHVNVTSLTGELDLRTGDGHITVEDLRGDLRLHSGDGHIEGNRLEGNLRAETSDGRIRVSGRFDMLDLHTGDGSIEADVREGSKLAGAWSLHTGDGSITLRLPSGLNADLDAQTSDGSISLDFPVTVSGDLGRSNVQGRINAGGMPLRVRTGDGHIRLLRI